MVNKSNSINFVLPELTEFEKVLSNRHYWTIAVSDSKFVIYRADTGFEALLLSPGIFISHWIRKSNAQGLIGTDIDDLSGKKGKKQIFNRESGVPVKLLLSKKGIIGKGANLILSDSAKIALSLNNMEELKKAIPELEFEYKE